MMREIFSSLQTAARSLYRARFFSILVVLILALGLGANAAIFAILNGVLFKPLPYPASQELLSIASVPPESAGVATDVSALDFFDWQKQVSTLKSLSAYMIFTPVLEGDGEPENLNAAAVVPGFFSTLQMHPLLGRTFVPEDGILGRNNYAILTYALWQGRFGGDPEVLGRTIQLDDELYEIVGVATKEHEIPSPRIQIFLPLAFAPEGYNRQGLVLTVIGRRNPGVTLAQVRSEMDALARAFEQKYPETNTGRGVRITPWLETRVGEFRSPLLALQIASGALLLMICLNVTGLLLTRVSAKRRELGIRQALGAGSWTLARGAMAESCLLASAGALLSWPVAAWFLRILLAFTPSKIPRIELIRIDGNVLLVSFLLAATVAVACGLLPALKSARRAPNSTLRGISPGTAGARRPRVALAGALVITEVALALCLLVGSGLLLRSLRELEKESKGFDPENLLVVQLALPRTRYPDGTRITSFQQRLLGELAALPQSLGAGLVSALPMQGGGSDFDVEVSVEGRGDEDRIEARKHANARMASPGYFRAMGTPLLSGRALSEDDDSDRPIVAVINETMANRFWPDGRAVGRQINIHLGGGRSCEVVGIVGDTRFDGLGRAPKPELFLSYLQLPTHFASIVLRTRSAPLDLVPAVKERIWRLDTKLPIFRAITMDQLVERSVAERRFNLRLLAAFGAAALLISVLGLYGVMARRVESQRHEIGVRMALGADRTNVRGGVLGQAMVLTGTGLILGAGLALILARSLEALLYGVSTTDVPTFLGSALALAAAAFLGAFLPARRAANTDPAQVLRVGN